MIILSPIEMTWNQGQKDDPEDLCAHGKVRFIIDGVSLVSENDGEWTVSAAALYLLRTLEQDHTKESPLFEHTFPCCGFNMYDIEDKENVIICGCPNGIDFQIIHLDLEVKIKTESNQIFIVSKKDWHKAVVGFSENVRNFYKLSSPKLLPDDDEDKKGYEKFMNEWRYRHESAIQI